jgi:hypothetical protein
VTRWVRGSVLLAGALGLLAALVTGNPLLAILPLLAWLVCAALALAPARTVALLALFLAIAIDSPQDRPMDGMWHSPTWIVGYWLFHNWSQNGGPSVLVFAGMHLLIALGLVAMLERTGRRFSLASCARASWVVFGLALGGLLLWGMASGGRFEPAYWQLRQLVLVPVVAWWLAQAVDFSRDGERVERVILGGALLKLALGFYFFYRIARPHGLAPTCITSHGDSMLFCLGIAIAVGRWLEAPTRAHLLRAWVIAPLLWGIYLNNRRLAYVGLVAVALVVLFLARRSEAKRRLQRLALLLVPCGLVYLAAGWSAKGPWAAPARAIHTMVAARTMRTQAATSTLWREVENFNLAQTMRAHPLGMGFGHEYERVVRKAADIGALFELWRFIPHNMLFGMLEIGGPLGFIALWLPLVLAIFLAVRSYRRARTSADRRLALISVNAVALYAILAFGDMATQYWSTTFLLGLALAISAQRSVALGAWENPRVEPGASPSPLTRAPELGA